MKFKVKLALMDFLAEKDMERYPILASGLIGVYKNFAPIGLLTIGEAKELFTIAETILERCALKNSERFWMEEHEEYFSEKTVLALRSNVPDGAERFETILREHFQNNNFQFKTVVNFLDEINLYAIRHSDEEFGNLLRYLGESLNIIETTFYDVRFKNSVGKEEAAELKSLIDAHIKNM